MMKIFAALSLYALLDFVLVQQQAIAVVDALFQPTSPVILRSPSSTTTSSAIKLPRRVPNNLEFKIHNHQYEREGSQTIVFEVPVRQNGVRMYIANDGTFDTQRPGNGGMRLLSYSSKQHAIEDAVRLAEGMTRKHAMYNTGFSGAKLVVDHGSLDLKDVDRETLMIDCARALNKLEGSIYTGCDINTNNDDMDILVSHTSYVLAGMDSSVDTNKATAMSVIGSILGILESHKEEVADNTFLVQGCGKVGTHVAEELVRLGAKEVKTCDLIPSNAAIQGCTPLDDKEMWFHQDVDFLVPCANSLAINDQVLREMDPPPRFIVGATNQPYSSQSVRAAFDAKGSLHVPESISSAGAILADSIEWTNPDLFRGGAAPSQIYGWIQDLSHAKAYELCQKAGNRADCIARALHQTYANQEKDPIGQSFPQWIAENTKFVDSLIVGGGMAGTAAAYANAKAGIKTLLVEQGDSLAPECASSNGDSRMYRQMYSNPFFSKMQTAALEQWKILEKECGEKLLHQNGLLFYGEDTGETVEGSVRGARDTMEELGLPHEYFATGDDISKRFPALETSGTPYSGVYEETAGHVRSSAACAAMARVAKEMGKLEVITKCKVTDIRIKDDIKCIDVVLQDGSMVVANSMIVAPGPWTNQFLQKHFNLSLDLDIWRIHWAHYEVDESINVPQCFFFRKESECGNDGGLYYCFPATATEARKASSPGKNVIKVGVDFKTTQAIDEPATMDDFSDETTEQVLEMMDRFVAEHLQGEATRVEDFVSPYTMTKDSYFIMDTLPGHSNIALFSGGSGRAFKFAPLLGDCLSRLAGGDKNFPIEDISCFSINRAAAGLRKFTEDEQELASNKKYFVS
jgi:glycine/D-amino acid oxidase-like deaminating enzyme/glutamate dehydrogenase/leucine dehydrogenase